MITRRGVLGGTLAATVGAVMAEEAMPTCEDIEKMAADIANAMQKVHGGRWNGFYDEDSAALFIFRDLIDRKA